MRMPWRTPTKTAGASFQLIATAFAQDSAAARKQWRHVADELRASLPSSPPCSTKPKSMSSPSWTSPEHWTKICSTNPIERPNGEIKRRTNVIGIFPNDDAIIRLVGAILIEQNDEWASNEPAT